MRGPGQRRLRRRRCAPRPRDQQVARRARHADAARHRRAARRCPSRCGKRLPGHRERLQIERLDMRGLAGDQRHRLAAEPRIGSRPAPAGRRRRGMHAEAVLAGDVGGGEDRHRSRQPGAPSREIAETEARARDGASGSPAPAARPRATRSAPNALAPRRPSAGPSSRSARGADRGAGGRALGRRACARRVQHRGDDLGIAGAAAQHAAQRLLDLAPRRARHCAAAGPLAAISMPGVQMPHCAAP